jgi:hypothetical protein
MTGNADMPGAGSTLRSMCSKVGGWRFSLLFVLYISVTVISIQAQPPVNYAIHANIIYRFTKYIDWPEERKTGDFIIGIVGETPLFDILNTFISNKMAGNQRIIVKRFVASASAFECHILFVGEDAIDNFKKIASRTAGTSTLLVSEFEGLANKGSCINFVIVNEHLQLEINKNNLIRRHLNIANELLSLGVVVQ